MLARGTQQCTSKQKRKLLPRSVSIKENYNSRLDSIESLPANIQRYHSNISTLTASLCVRACVCVCICVCVCVCACVCVYCLCNWQQTLNASVSHTSYPVVAPGSDPPLSPERLYCSSLQTSACLTSTSPCRRQLEELLEDRAGLLVDEARDALHTTTTGEMANGRLGDPLDVVTEHLAVMLNWLRPCRKGKAMAESLQAGCTSHERRV